MTRSPPIERQAPWLLRLPSLLGLGIAASLLVAAADRDPRAAAAESRPAETAVHQVQDDVVRVTIRVDPTDVTVPESVRLSLSVETDGDVEVLWPEIDNPLGPFGVGEMHEAPPSKQGAGRRLERTWTLETFVGGDFAIPSLTIRYVDRRERVDGSTAAVEGEIATPTVPVKVRPGLADAKPVVSLPMPGWQMVMLWAFGVVAALVAVALAARWWRKRRRLTAQDAAGEPQRPPHEWALAELDRLLAEDLIRKGQIREFYYRINGLLRRYIELRFGLRAGEQTSEEFIVSLRESRDFADEHKALLGRFVAACDPVKYARHQPEPEEMDWVQTTAREFILNTAPADSAPTAAARPPA